MFKKRCSKCSSKVSKSFDFCPYCGSPFEKDGDYGLLGKNDDANEVDKFFGSRMPSMGGMGGLGSGLGASFMEKMLGSALKALDKEMRELNEQEARIDRVSPENVKTDFQLFINGKKVNLPTNFNGNISTVNNNQKPEQKKAKAPQISEEILKKAAKLPRKEAKTKLTRLKDKVVYELDTPGLDDINNVIINKLENSLEIKAYTAKAVFFKNLAVKLPLMQYGLKENKLILEFKTQ